MRCVSYTRTTSCKSSESIPTDIIQQQNEQIQKYIQSHGWKLVAKYSDRKRDDNENTAFEEMTMDGISRKFDMVVVNSIDRCGKYISCAEDVLAKTFFPAGIHFSVVQDDFCSIGKSREEIGEYFRKEKIAVQIKSMREFAVREQLKGIITYMMKSMDTYFQKTGKSYWLKKKQLRLYAKCFRCFWMDVQ